MEKPKILTKKEITSQLKTVPGWKYADNKISKQFEFKDFMDALSFINKLAPFFEKHDHHPDTFIMYSKIRFELQRFDIGGKVTNRDFLIASEIERQYKKR